jgi:hypothetical protein
MNDLIIMVYGFVTGFGIDRFSLPSWQFCRTGPRRSAAQNTRLAVICEASGLAPHRACVRQLVTAMSAASTASPASKTNARRLTASERSEEDTQNLAYPW